MKIFGDYLRRHLGGIGIFLACCGIFVLVFSLYDLPAEAVLYGGVLSAAVIAGHLWQSFPSQLVLRLLHNRPGRNHKSCPESSHHRISVRHQSTSSAMQRKAVPL